MQPRSTGGGSPRGARARGSGGAPRDGAALVSRGPPVGQGILQSGPTSLPATRVRLARVKRPGFGTTDARTRMIVNALKMTTQDAFMIYHYNATPNKTYPPQLNVQLIKTLQHDTAPQVFNPAGAYDGKKNLFMPRRLNLGASDSRVFEVILPANGHPEGRPPLSYKVKISFAAEINTTVLRRFVQGTRSQDEQVLTALKALNVIIRADSIINHPFNVRSFFPINRNRASVGYRFDLVRGYFQSVRPAIGKLLDTVDTSTGLSLFEVAFDFFNVPPDKRNPLMFSSQGGFDWRKQLSLQRFLTNVRVSIVPSNRIVTIARLSEEGADQFRFPLRGGGKRTVAQHFHQQNRPLQYPSVFCVMNSKGSAIPFEKCTVLPGQLARKQVPPEFTGAAVEYPRKRADDNTRSLAYGKSEYVSKFGSNINSGSFPRVETRTIKPPPLKYGRGDEKAAILPKFGSLNMMDKKLVTPIRIERWVVVVFESPRKVTEAKVREMIKDYIKACNTFGVTVAKHDPIVNYANGQGNINDQLRAAGKACVDKNRAGGPDLIFVILPEHGNDIYRAVKHFGDCVMGVATQCLKSNKCLRANMQYWTNVCLKTNSKLGGVNVVPDGADAPFLVDTHNPTIIMGADVMQPSPGFNSPSFTAVVGNVDAEVSKYNATSNVQEGQVEIITNLGSMAKSILLNYKSHREQVEKVGSNQSAPKRLIFFRDGVSEGQFAQVCDQELEILKNVCADLKIKVGITFILVSKRQHHRSEPSQDQGDRSGNMLAGTGVDQRIAHPVEFDLCLQSHAGLIGNSRPSHYSVLHDDNNFSVDALQSLCSTLCHAYAPSTRSISIPAPVYYADMVCARAKNHFDPLGNLNMSGTATQVSNSAGGTPDIQSYKAAYKQVTGNMSKRMYFVVR
ncbi:argonaute-like protein [Dendrothele bispora CBS 962.96]|uniref:Argonaute-like protein n=1 Tax=Dendrothele bispora (strain CBS 962.96) TaxID=1314807 RepID=A0A4S8LQE0_DENBC|nr:argonaute-like protein [Dendrothele bispora CBS 962.96]